MSADTMTHHQFYHRSAQPQKHFFNHDKKAFSNAKMSKKAYGKWAHAEREIPSKVKSINKPQKSFHKGHKGVYNGPVPRQVPACRPSTAADCVSRPPQGRISPHQQKQQPQQFHQQPQQFHQQPQQPKRFFVDLNAHKPQKSAKEAPLIPTMPTTITPTATASTVAAANENKPFDMDVQMNIVVVSGRQVLKSPFFNGVFDLRKLVECAGKGLFFD
uniref:Ski_Sno domain-containing protein n=1 Tax=Steinernema glaseri TaxID=37863 RepID=A0A1I7ZVK5_9BILA